MKKSILIVLSVIFCFSLLNAQHLQIYYNSNLMSNGATITKTGDVNELIVVKLSVKNTTVDTIAVKAKKIENSLVFNSENYFCYAGGCYTPQTYISPGSTKIPGNTTDTSFSADYSSMGTPGTSTITYVFFNISNTSDSICLKVNFTTAVGVNENNKSIVTVSEAFPNPASNQVRFNFNLNNQHGQAKISIRNILGACIAELPIQNNETNVMYNTSNLIDGIYFYSLVIDDKTYSSKKLIIKH
jgi:hypothetical protein